MNKISLWVAISWLWLVGPVHLLPARAEEDTVAWMASRLEAGKDILDWELALNKFASYPDPRVLPVLLKIADSQDPTARAEAAGVLWSYNTKEVREKLVQLSSVPAVEVRLEAAKSLCMMKFCASLKVLEDALKSQDPKIRSRCLRALGAIQEEGARKLAQSLKDSTQASDRIWTAYALLRQGVSPDKQLDLLEKTLLSMPAAAWLPGKNDPAPSDLEQSAALATPRLGERLEAASALSRIGSPAALAILARATADLAATNDPHGPLQLLLRHGDQAAPALAAAMSNPKVLVRYGSVRCAREIRPQSEDARTLLARSLDKVSVDPARVVRVAALRSIASLDLVADVPSLLALLGHADPATRLATARTLGVLHRPEFFDPLLERLQKETTRSVRRGLFMALASLRSPRVVEPMLQRLKELHQQSRQNSQAADELPYCIQALASGGDATAERMLAMLPKISDDRRQLLIEVLARSGSEKGLDFFIDQLRENPPEPDSPAARFFDSLDERFVPRLKALIESESALWTRVILARALFRLGQDEFGRGILWGLNNEDPVLRRLAAALSKGLQLKGLVPALEKLLTDPQDTAGFAARSLLAENSPSAMRALLQGLPQSTLRQRRPVPLEVSWEDKPSALHPYAKDVSNEQVWVAFADGRLGRNLDLFLTWSLDGKIWNDPVFTGLTSFYDPEGQVAPPTFSLSVKNRDITLSHTYTFAQSPDPEKPSFKTLQRVHQYKYQDFFKDQDDDQLKDLEEGAIFTNPQNRDSDGDQLPDGQDKNPLARPAKLDRDDEVLKLLAFSYSCLIKETIPPQTKLLVVQVSPESAFIPELPTFPWLVLHLRPDQIRALWQATGGGYPRISFGPTRIVTGELRAVQPMTLRKSADDTMEIEVSFIKKEGQWIVSGYKDELQ